MPQDWKDILQGRFSDLIASLPPDPEPAEAAAQAPALGKQRLVVSIDRRRRAGKQVTVVAGFNGDDGAVAELGRKLKTRLGVGGTAGEGEIVLQGDVRDKVVAMLNEMGHSAKRGN